MKTGMPLVGLATHTHKPSCCLNQELKSKKKKKSWEFWWKITSFYYTGLC